MSKSHLTKKTVKCLIKYQKNINQNYLVAF